MHDPRVGRVEPLQRDMRRRVQGAAARVHVPVAPRCRQLPRRAYPARAVPWRKAGLQVQFIF